MLPATTSPGAATTATTVNKPVRSPASLDNIEMMAARAAIVTPDAILSSSGTCRTQTEAENLKSRAPRPFTLLINGMSVGTCNEASQVTIGCVLSSKSIPHKRSSTTRSSLERGNSLTPVYCYKADANTSKESCRSKRYKMLPAGTYCLAEKIKEKELYRTGLFPHVTSGHFEAGGVWKPPKLKTLEESYAQQYNEMVCTHYSPECIDCFLITSESSLAMFRITVEESEILCIPGTSNCLLPWHAEMFNLFTEHSQARYFQQSGMAKMTGIQPSVQR